MIWLLVGDHTDHERFDPIPIAVAFYQEAMANKRTLRSYILQKLKTVAQE